MLVTARGYFTTWADGNHQLAPEMGLNTVCHGPTDPGSLHCAQATHLHPKVIVFAIQTTDGVMGASAQVMDQEGQQKHFKLEGHMATKASAPMQLCHSLQAFHTSCSHATTSSPCAPSPSANGNGSTQPGPSLF